MSPQGHTHGKRWNQLPAGACTNCGGRVAFYKLPPVVWSLSAGPPPTRAREGVPLQVDPSNCHSICPLSRGGPVFPQSFLQAGEMLQCLLLEGEEGTDSEERGQFHRRFKRNRHPGFCEREHWGSKWASECPAARQEEEEEKEVRTER